jgi:uncharacterized protein
MKASKVIGVVVVAALVAMVLYSLSGNSSDAGYVAKVEQERKAKNEFMLSGEGSPFEGNEQNFKGLNYFPPDESFRIQANLEPVEEKKIVILPTSDGKEKRYLEYAYATFKRDGIDNRLLLLEIVDQGPFRGTLFLAFADETSARETYGAGRYLDVKKVPGATTMLLDFNEAYNPYCAFSDKFSCPLPPRENLLKVAIRAGEKNYEAH